jgi:hypothetical protein
MIGRVLTSDELQILMAIARDARVAIGDDSQTGVTTEGAMAGNLLTTCPAFAALTPEFQALVIAFLKEPL